MESIVFAMEAQWFQPRSLFRQTRIMPVTGTPVMFHLERNISLQPERPIRSVKTAWKATMKRAGVPHFPIYNLRHAFCTRLSWVAPDAVIQRAMRHASPETKRVYQLGLVEPVREAMERANQRVYGGNVLVN